jgi:lipopolysaccharide heptosyltransferase II
MFNVLKALLRTTYVKTRCILLWPILLLRKTKKLLKEEIRSILFLRHDRIGDMVLSTAALKALRRVYPEAKITVLASERNYEVLRHNPYVDQILIYKGIPWFIKEIRPRSYDLVIDPFLTYELRHAFMTLLAGGRYRVGFEEAGREVFFNLDGPEPSTPKRMVDHLLDLVESVGGESAGYVPEVFLSDKELRWGSETLVSKGININKLTIAIHPGAYYPSQRWPAERFGELARAILEQGETNVILLGSRDEEALLRDVKKIAGNGVQVFSGLKLRELMVLLSKCGLLVCNNSGPLHIATALKVPTVSLVGPTVTPLWLPFGKHHVVIKKELSCTPCNRAVCRKHECMELITVDEVFEAVKSQLVNIKSKQKKRSSHKEGVIN